MVQEGVPSTPDGNIPAMSKGELEPGAEVWVLSTGYKGYRNVDSPNMRKHLSQRVSRH